jgi:hypothetical protein
MQTHYPISANNEQSTEVHDGEQRKSRKSSALLKYLEIQLASLEKIEKWVVSP